MLAHGALWTYMSCWSLGDNSLSCVSGKQLLDRCDNYNNIMLFYFSHLGRWTQEAEANSQEVNPYYR